MSDIWVNDYFPRDFLEYKRRVALDAAVRASERSCGAIAAFRLIDDTPEGNEFFNDIAVDYGWDRHIRAEFSRLMSAA